MEEVFVTTLNTDNYLIGVLTLANDLKKYCVHKLVVLVSKDLKENTYQILEMEGIPYIKVDAIPLEPSLDSTENQNEMFRHWKNTFFKLKVFDLVQFNKIVFIDSDMMVRDSLDELFDKKHMSATIAGKSFPGNEDFKEINSGLFVFEPEEGLSETLLSYIPVVGKEKKNFGDQDVLAHYFSDWKYREDLHLSEKYNVFWNYYEYYHKLYRKDKIKVIHYIGHDKPWMMGKLRIMREYIKCLVRGRVHSIAIMKQYRKEIQKICSKYRLLLEKVW